MKIYLYLFVILLISCKTKEKYKVVFGQEKSYLINENDENVDSIPHSITRLSFDLRNDTSLVDSLFYKFGRGGHNICQYLDSFPMTSFYIRITQPFEADVSNYILRHREHFSDTIYKNPVNLISVSLDKFLYDKEDENLLVINSNKILDSVEFLFKSDKSYTDLSYTDNCIYKRQLYHLRFIKDHMNLKDYYYFVCLRKVYNIQKSLLVEARIKKDKVYIRVINPEFMSCNFSYWIRF